MCDFLVSLASSAEVLFGFGRGAKANNPAKIEGF
jgi:hypothetical protein